MRGRSVLFSRPTHVDSAPVAPCVAFVGYDDMSSLHRLRRGDCSFHEWSRHHADDAVGQGWLDGGCASFVADALSGHHEESECFGVDAWTV